MFEHDITCPFKRTAKVGFYFLIFNSLSEKSLNDRCRKSDLNAEDVLTIRKAYLVQLLKVVPLSALAFSNLSIAKELKQMLQSGLGGHN
jgi:hypothetical protein